MARIGRMRAELRSRPATGAKLLEGETVQASAHTHDGFPHRSSSRIRAIRAIRGQPPSVFRLGVLRREPVGDEGTTNHTNRTNEGRATFVALDWR